MHLDMMMSKNRLRLTSALWKATNAVYTIAKQRSDPGTN